MTPQQRVYNINYLEGRVTVVVGDITKQIVDVIVNAANSTLLGGGGVDGAIHSGGGKAIYDECKTIRETLYPKGLPVGDAVITTGGNLKAKFVIHTVGPVYGRTEDYSERLYDCYTNSLELAEKNSLNTIAIPSISTGAFGYPRHEAAVIAATACGNFVERNSSVEQIFLVFLSESDARMFTKHQKFLIRSQSI